MGANGQLAFGRHLRIDMASTAGRGTGTSAKYEGSKCIFLGNMPFDTQEEALWQVRREAAARVRAEGDGPHDPPSTHSQIESTCSF